MDRQDELADPSHIPIQPSLSERARRSPAGARRTTSSLIGNQLTWMIAGKETRGELSSTSRVLRAAAAAAAGPDERILLVAAATWRARISSSLAAGVTTHK